jgi:hypothetical protein
MALLVRQGYVPYIELVQQVPLSELERAEQYWIAYYRSIGCRLTNGTVGGEKVVFTDEVRVRQSTAAKRKFRNPEMLAKYLGNQNSAGRVLSAESLEKIAEGNRRRYGYPWDRLAIDYERLGTCTAVAAEYGCNPESVRRNLKRLEISTKNLLNWNHLQEDYKSLGSTREVARAYGCRTTAVSAELKRQGVVIPVTNSGRKYVWSDERRANHKAATNTPEFKEAHRVAMIHRLTD